MITVKQTEQHNLVEIIEEVFPEEFDEKIMKFNNCIDKGLSVCMVDGDKTLGIAGIAKANDTTGLYWGCFSEDIRKHSKELYQSAFDLLDIGASILMVTRIVALIDPEIQRDIRFITRLGFEKTEHVVKKLDLYQLRGDVYGTTNTD